jgi:hypothetical protein
VKENEIYGYQPLANVNIRGARSNESFYYLDGDKMKSSDNNEIEFQKIKIQSSIYIKFSIK